MSYLKPPKIIYPLVIFLLASCSIGSDKEIPEEAKILDQDSEKANQTEESENKSEISDSEEEEKEDFTEIELLSEAIRSYDAGRFMISKNFWEKIIQNYPGSPLSLTAELKMADCLFYADRFIEAIAIYREFAKVHSKHEARPYSLFQIAEAFKSTYQGTKQDLTPLKEAIKQYLVLISEYPNSTYANQASKQILVVEEELFKSELSVIEFYSRTGNAKSAESRQLELKKLFGHLDSYQKMFGDKVEEYTPVVSSDVTKDESTLGETQNAGSEDKLKSEITPVEEKLAQAISPIPTNSPSPLPSLLIQPTEEKILPSVQASASKEVASPSPTIQPTEAVKEKVEVSVMPPATIEMARSSLEPSSTTELVVTEEEPKYKTTQLPTAQATPTRRPGNLKTLADLEQVEEAIIARMASPKGSAEVKEQVVEKQIAGDASAENKPFLRSLRCEQEDGISKIFIKFNSRPFLKSSLKDGEGKTRTTIIFQEGFSTDPSPADLNEDEWDKRPSKVCLQSGQESVVVQERIKIPSEGNQFGPKSYIFVYVNSARMNKISIVNGSTPESLAIVAQDLE